jgi:NTE family protein
VGSPFDLVLSSGFLAFGRHLGVLQAIERAGIEVDGLCGTSSGALIGALWAAGHSPEAILAEVTRWRMLRWLRPSPTPWRGLCSMSAILDHVRTLLPEQVSDLDRPFGVGVRAPGGRHALLTEGPLPEAVMASCAMPGIFAAVTIDGRRYLDGGAVDRVGLAAWRALRGARPTLVHVVDRTAGARDEGALDGAAVVRTPRSGASFWSLGDVRGRVDEARGLAERVLSTLA